MPRIKRPRRILNPPSIKGFKPYGLDSEGTAAEPVTVLFEEYEALRLSDYDSLNHHQASVMMGVSRPTFTRIYASALQKIAVAFVEGRQITIEGGKVYFDSEWHHCNACGCYFNHPHKNIPNEMCPLCGSKEIVDFDFPEGNQLLHLEDMCICPGCHSEQAHQPGQPCKEQICPECGHNMMRAGAAGKRGLKKKKI
ncbi:MAG: DUF134 domain-containing protein [Lentimicrobiaceae bacterium]|jgi:predicted DNA-binding protein (UPF0251 family)|nr:DUF134 domain-containing protein [Lentimicrobiaceae bacterium]MDY0026798.1 DUF134 domain-containing protein [Lentimicrobium sp.]